MRWHAGDYICAQCGAVLSIGEDEAPRVTIHGASGRRNERVITVGGVEIHRCRAPVDSVEMRREALESLDADR
jgi:hypothetical protein